MIVSQNTCLKVLTSRYCIWCCEVSDDAKEQETKDSCHEMVMVMDMDMMEIVILMLIFMMRIRWTTRRSSGSSTTSMLVIV